MDRQIRRWLGNYLAGDISLADFEEWFMSATWDVHRSGNSLAIALAEEIKLRLAELSGGHWTEEEFKSEIQKFAPAWTSVRPNVIAGSSSVTMPSMVAPFPLRIAGTPSEVVPA